MEIRVKLFLGKNKFRKRSQIRTWVGFFVQFYFNRVWGKNISIFKLQLYFLGHTLIKIIAEQPFTVVIATGLVHQHISKGGKGVMDLLSIKVTTIAASAQDTNYTRLGSDRKYGSSQIFGNGNQSIGKQFLQHLLQHSSRGSCATAGSVKIDKFYR